MEIMKKEIQSNSIDIVMTSPFYNTARKTMNERAYKDLNRRYDIHLDDMTDEEYISFTVNLFKEYDRVLEANGLVLYNLSYSAEKPSLMYQVIAEVVNKTEFIVADTIVWKKKSAIPNNMNSNRLTRIVEFVFVLCRKSELKTFNANKKVVSVREKTGQKNYENIYNFVEARNNDGANKLNKATFSTELVDKLLYIYAKDNSVILDNFNGTGTTAVSAINNGHRFIGCELSLPQCEFSIERVKKETSNSLVLK